MKKILNESIFQHFSALITPDLEFQSFAEKSDSVTFEPLYPPTFMQSFKKILRANSEKSALQTHVRTDELTNEHEFIGPCRQGGGPIKN